ncbi:MAG TPA: histidine phosphatase family protein [Stellaceae bacterium]|jgi:phosphohistidine phosphatase|nr:histidine phosphatase family protein [Stellaceae bacterium]
MAANMAAHHLHLLRHAKAASDDGVEDDQRPLNRRGREEARRVGETLPAALGALDLVLCSAAVRTRETAELVLAHFATPPRMLFEQGLYLAGRAALMRRLRRLDEADGTILLIGHNPGLHELALALAAIDSPGYPALAAGKFPTAVRASFMITSAWENLDQSRHAMTGYMTPKSLHG